MVQVTLLSFDKTVGWRIVASSFTNYSSRVAVVKIGSVKLLRLSNTKSCRPGHFANPRKLIGV